MNTDSRPGEELLYRVGVARRPHEELPGDDLLWFITVLMIDADRDRAAAR